MYVRFETRRSGRGMFDVIARVRAEPHKLRRHRAELERLANRLWDDTPAVEEEMYDTRARMPRARTWWGPGAGALARDAWEFRRLARRAGIRLRVLVSRDAPGVVRWSDEVQAVIFAETRAMRQAVVKPRGVEGRAERWNGDRATIRGMRTRDG
jgi:hypothetical protein